MSLLAWIILFTLLGGVLSVLAAAVFLLLSESLRTRLLPAMVSFGHRRAARRGVSGGAAHALAALACAICTPSLARSCSACWDSSCLRSWCCGVTAMAHECEAHGSHTEVNRNARFASRTQPCLRIRLSDPVRRRRAQLRDGVLIAAAFLTDLHLGVSTALAVARTRSPQEVGDFAILLHSGLRVARRCSTTCWRA